MGDAALENQKSRVAAIAVKFSLLRFSFCISLVVHAVAASVAVFGLGALLRAPSPEGGSEIVFSLVAASDEPISEGENPGTMPPIALAPVFQKPIEPKIEPIIPALVPELEPAKIAPVPTVVAVAPSARLDPAPSEMKYRGDNSSPEPGEDRTSSEPTIGASAQPAYRKNPEPIYPPSAKRRGQEGTVLLTVKVTAAGRVAEVKVKSSSGVEALDEAAARAVRRWEFEPARVHSTNVESQVDVPVRFKLVQDSIGG
jgi:protein TonB